MRDDKKYQERAVPVVEENDKKRREASSEPQERAEFGFAVKTLKLSTLLSCCNARFARDRWTKGTKGGQFGISEYLTYTPTGYKVS